MEQVTIAASTAHLQSVSLNVDAAVILPVTIGAVHHFSRSALITTATGAARAPAAADDITVEGSLDGVLFFGLGTAGAALVVEMDGPTAASVVPQTSVAGTPIAFLRFTAGAQILTTETATVMVHSSIS